MNCYVHPDAAAIGACTSCGRGICSDCAVEVGRKLVCRECLAKGLPAPSKDANTAFLIELLAGFFGFLGIGYLYAGRTNDGILRLILWMLYDIFAAVMITLLISIIIGLVCIPIQLIIQVGVPLWSANKLKKELLNEQGAGTDLAKMG